MSHTVRQPARGLSRRIVLPLIAAALAAVGPAPSPAAAARPYEVIQTFVERFNERDLDGLLALAHPEVEWLSVDGAAIAVEARGREALRESLTAYFASCASCRSEVEVYQTAGPFTSTLEHAQWTTADGGTKRQSAIAVYELADGLVRRVWYYPAVAAEAAAAEEPAP